MSRCSRHAWVDEVGICTVVTQGIVTNSKPIASYAQTVMQLDTKLHSIFENCIVETTLCCDDQYLYFQYSCVVATSFVHTADKWGLNL